MSLHQLVYKLMAMVGHMIMMVTANVLMVTCVALCYITWKMVKWIQMKTMTGATSKQEQEEEATYPTTPAPASH